MISGWGDSSKGRFLLEDKNKYLIIIQKRATHASVRVL